MDAPEGEDRGIDSQLNIHYDELDGELHTSILADQELEKRLMNT